MTKEHNDHEMSITRETTERSTAHARAHKHAYAVITHMHTHTPCCLILNFHLWNLWSDPNCSTVTKVDIYISYFVSISVFYLVIVLSWTQASFLTDFQTLTLGWRGCIDTKQGKSLEFCFTFVGGKDDWTLPLSHCTSASKAWIDSSKWLNI